MCVQLLRTLLPLAHETLLFYKVVVAENVVVQLFVNERILYYKK